jgi:hypothetical protein
MDWYELAAQVSGPDAGAVMRSHILAIKQAFRENAHGPFATVIDQFTFILRVDGSVRTWSIPEVGGIDFNPKKKYISIDIHIPLGVWQAGDRSVCHHIDRTFRLGLADMITKLQSKSVSVDEEAAKDSLSKALRQYSHVNL